MKLGYARNSCPFLLSLSSLHDNGGFICRLAVYVLRVYPLLFITKTEEGETKRTTFLRSEKVERRHCRLEDRKRLDLIEILYSQVSREVEDEFEIKRKSIKPPRKKVAEMEEAEELWELMERASDPAGVEVRFYL